MIYPEECGMTLKEKQALPLETKLAMTRWRIKEWAEHWGGKVHISFSGGKDSTVVAHIARDMYPNTELVFVDTGIEFPEIRSFALSQVNVIKLKPKMSFYRVLQHYGYPVIGRRAASALHKLRNHNLTEKYRNKLLYGDEKGDVGMLALKWHYLINAPFKISDACCDVMKKRPLNSLTTMPITGKMASEGPSRKISSRRCNDVNMKHPISQPLLFWTEADIWEYVKQNNVPVSEIYSMGYKRTGCIFCMFGVHFDHKTMGGINRFQLLKQTHPKKWQYCMDNLGIRQVMDFLGLPVE